MHLHEDAPPGAVNGTAHAGSDSSPRHHEHDSSYPCWTHETNWTRAHAANSHAGHTAGDDKHDDPDDHVVLRNIIIPDGISYLEHAEYSRDVCVCHRFLSPRENPWVSARWQSSSKRGVGEPDLGETTPYPRTKLIGTVFLRGLVLINFCPRDHARPPSDHPLETDAGHEAYQALGLSLGDKNR